MNTDLLTTPLHAWHVSAGARMAAFAQYEMPIQYSSIVAEHTATRTRATLFDISHMGRFRFDGSRADQFLDSLLTRRVTDMEIGDIRYSLMCNESGGILDDVLVYCLEGTDGNTYFLLVVNAGNKLKIRDWVQSRLPEFADVQFRDVSDQTAMIAVQGPQAISIAEKIYPRTPLGKLGYYRGRIADQFGKPTIVSRTGYTGEDGLEIIVRAEDALRVWENLLLAGRNEGILPAGLGARDTLRLEAAMPLYGHELSEETNPFQAGLGRVVNFKDRTFVGYEELKLASRQPPFFTRVGIRLDGRRAAREHAKVLDFDNREIGTVSSGSFSPTLEHPIAMAYIRTDVANAGTAVDIDIRGSKVPGTLVSLPFYRRKSA